MARSKSLSKGTSKNQSIESVDFDIKTSGSTTSNKSVQSANVSNSQTTVHDSSDNNKSKSQPNRRFNLVFCLMFSLSISNQR